MIAKIGRGANIIGALSYNQLKVDQENGAILANNRIRETVNGQFTVNQLYSSFEPYLMANKRTEKPVLHISLNPNPKDNVSDENFKLIAKDYMELMGYGDQPYVVFKHTDIERTHIHIVSTCVDRYGKKLPDSYEKLRSMNACRELEQKYQLLPATEKNHNSKEVIFKPVDYKEANVKSQIASVIRHLPKYYKYQSLGAYNALLSLFNITAEQITGEIQGRTKQGLVYFVLDEKGEKATNPFKSSLFGKQAGMDSLQNHFEQSKEKMKTEPAKEILKKTIEVAIHTSYNETDFKKQLLEQGVNTIVRRNDQGRIYGMTFIDHESRTVWNGSQLSKNLSANVFNELWKNDGTQKVQNDSKINKIDLSKNQEKDSKPENEKPHALFDFHNGNNSIHSNTDCGLIESLGSLLPNAQGEDYEEQAFANQMKKKAKRNNRRGKK
ncbi:conjugal transfer protein MobB [Flavobacterium frigoris]|uniref:Relaxase/Mobilisation nuclease domain-containing protein n=1 Tax=Flavobacterium frigoris TaxID=229204 RepID=A0A1H9MYZ9_FLAFI|nr:conjugal transfer protein MobB [Flavobacterium frigoris]SER28323.1 Relaxase/Mobilisation nuclease domain-containing protein [Flavobacterium frigoris]